MSPLLSVVTRVLTPERQGANGKLGILARERNETEDSLRCKFCHNFVEIEAPPTNFRQNLCWSAVGIFSGITCTWESC